MRKKNFKGRCEKRVLGKCAEVCRTYDAIQYAYADLLQASNEVVEIRCNVLLDGLEVGEYTSDFVCTKADGDLMVRECVFRAYTGLNLPHAREKPATSPENFRHLAGEGCQCKRETTYCEEHTKNV